MCEHPLKIYFNRALPIDWNVNQDKKYTKAKWQSKPYYYSVKVPCGWCLECKLAKAKDWAVRIMAEAKYWKKNCFVTLTYNNEHLPIKNGKMTLHKEDVKLFFKRLLKNQNSNKFNPIRRFYCGEYGPKGGRPHYHAIIFNYCPDDLKFYKKGKNGDNIYKSKSLQKLWGKGFVTVGTVTTMSAGYCARYTMKKAGIKPKKCYKIPNRAYHPVKNPKVNKWIKLYQKTDKEPEFVQASRRMGLGHGYFVENYNKLKLQENFYAKENGKMKIFPLPIYFLNMWKKKDPEEYYKFCYKREKEAEKRIKEELAKYPKGTTEEMLRKMWSKTRKIKARQLKRQETFEEPENFKKVLDN